MTHAAPVIARFSIDYIVTRREPGVYVEGRFVDGGSASFPGSGSVQPASGKDLQQVPEASRTREILKLFTMDELFTASETQGRDSDRVNINGIDYEVQSEIRWRVKSLDHNQYLLVAHEQTDSGLIGEVKS